MLVCHCKVVYDRDITQQMSRGARDPFDIADACGAGTVCGGCVPAICQLLGEPATADTLPLPLPVRVAS